MSEAASAAEDSIANAASEDYFVQCLQNGDPEAFDKLILRFSPDIYGILFRLTENREEAADLTQETFLSALKAI
ncbi:hypothetical protein OFN33_31075, partial [Escherichia coli]|nr:hypothetical protein [Escherichia coli]